MNTTRDLAMNFAMKYCGTHNEDLFIITEQIYQFLIKKENITNTTIDLAMSLAIQYCATHVNEDLLIMAEQIYQFLIKKEE